MNHSIHNNKTTSLTDCNSRSNIYRIPLPPNTCLVRIIYISVLESTENEREMCYICIGSSLIFCLFYKSNSPSHFSIFTKLLFLSRRKNGERGILECILISPLKSCSKVLRYDILGTMFLAKTYWASHCKHSILYELR